LLEPLFEGLFFLLDPSLEALGLGPALAGLFLSPPGEPLGLLFGFLKDFL